MATRVPGELISIPPPSHNHAAWILKTHVMHEATAMIKQRTASRFAIAVCWVITVCAAGTACTVVIWSDIFPIERRWPVGRLRDERVVYVPGYAPGSCTSQTPTVSHSNILTAV